MQFDLSEDDLRQYGSRQVDPPDFDEFWSRSISEADSIPLDASFTRVETPLTHLDVFDVSFRGFGGQPIRGWLKTPRTRHGGPIPAVVEFIGYGGGRGLPMENLLFSSAGFAHLVMDTRGQGSSWSVGVTPDNFASNGPQTPGVMTRGIESKESYYYRRLIIDGVRAVGAVRAFDGVDDQRVAVHGISQGGGIALAVGSLAPGLSAVVARVPFLCDFPRATTITNSHPYREVTHYLSVQRERAADALATLAYFDGVNFAKRITAPTHVSTALMDDVCPPSTVFGAYNSITAAKSIRVWPHNAHEGGQGFDDQDAIAFLGVHLGTAAPVVA